MSLKPILSKSTFLKGLQCDKHLYLYKNHYTWQDKVSELNYIGLDIADGTSASIAFEQLLEENDMIKIQETRDNLLAYCKLDTIAMVEILKFMFNIN